MIPFEADPMMYGACAFFLIACILLIVLAIVIPETPTMCCVFAMISFVAFVGMGGAIYTGSTQQIDITVCNHIIDDNYMYIVDENDQTYFIYDPSLKLKIRDGEKIKATIMNGWGNAYPKIYKIDAPFVCGDGC